MKTVKIVGSKNNKKINIKYYQGKIMERKSILFKYSKLNKNNLNKYRYQDQATLVSKLVELSHNISDLDKKIYELFDECEYKIKFISRDKYHAYINKYDKVKQNYINTKKIYDEIITRAFMINKKEELIEAIETFQQIRNKFKIQFLYINELLKLKDF